MNGYKSALEDLINYLKKDRGTNMKEQVLNANWVLLAVFIAKTSGNKVGDVIDALNKVANEEEQQ